MTEQIIDELAPTYTASQMADYWTRQVLQGKGQWTAQLDPRGLDNRRTCDTTLRLVIPTEDQMYDTKREIIFAAVRF